MYKISVHGNKLKFDQIVLDSSPFLGTLFTTDNMVERLDGIIVFDKFPVEDMRTYIEYCTTGIMRYLIVDVLEYMSHKLLNTGNMDTKYIIAAYEDQWHMNNGILPDPEETIYSLRSLVSHMLKGRMYVIDREQVKIATHSGCVKYMGVSSVDYNGQLVYDLETLLDGQVYAISTTNSVIQIHIIGDGIPFDIEQGHQLNTHEAIIVFMYSVSYGDSETASHSSLVDILYGLPDTLGSILYEGKIYRTSKHQYYLGK